jgi:hypothetical protein
LNIILTPPAQFSVLQRFLQGQRISSFNLRSFLKKIEKPFSQNAAERLPPVSCGGAEAGVSLLSSALRDQRFTDCEESTSKEICCPAVLKETVNMVN